MQKIPEKNSTGSLSLNGSPIWPKSRFLLAVAIFLYSFLYKFPATPFFTDGDQSIFLCEAERMFNGDVMYRDFFEFTLPGTQALYAFLFSIFGPYYWIVGATTVVVGVVSAFLLVSISEKIIPNPFSYLPAFLYIFFGFRWFGLDGSHRMFSPIFILLAIWLLMRGKTAFYLMMTGCSLGVASFFTQQRGFVALAAIILFLFIGAKSNRKGWKIFLRQASIISAAFLLSLTAFCLYFVLAAGVDNFFYATLSYPFQFYSYGHPNSFGVYFADLRKVFTIATVSDVLEIGPVVFHAILLPFSTLILLVAFTKTRNRIDWNVWQFPVLIALVGLFLTLSTTAPNQFRLFQISGPSLIVMVWLLSRFELSPPLKRRLFNVVAAGLMLLGAFQAIRMQTNWEFVDLDFPSGKLTMVNSPQAQRYLWLSRNTKPGDYFFEVYEPFVYFPLKLKNPTRFGQIWPSDYTRPEHVAEVITDLELKRPKYILFDNAYLATATHRAVGDHTGPLADFVQNSYFPIGDIYDLDGRPVQIWELKTR